MYICVCVCTYINIKSVNYRQSTYVFMIIFMHKITLPQLISSTSQNFYCSALYCWFETDISQFSQTEESKKKSTSQLFIPKQIFSSFVPIHNLIIFHSGFSCLHAQPVVWHVKNLFRMLNQIFSFL